MMLTDEQCNEFRRLPLSFNDMVRAIHAAGQRDMRERAANACVSLFDMDDDSCNEAEKCAVAIQNLEIE